MASWDWFQKHQLEQRIRQCQQQEEQQASNRIRSLTPEVHLTSRSASSDHGPPRPPSSQERQSFHSPVFFDKTHSAHGKVSPLLATPSGGATTPKPSTPTSELSSRTIPVEDVDSYGQEFVDEEGHEYRAAIQHLADEQERVQRKVFMNWINYHVPNCIKSNLIEELRDGTKLLALLEALTGQKLPGERGKRLRRPHFISNVNIVLQFLEKRRVKLVNINATDIVDGNPCIILGLIWTLILHFHIEEYVRLNAIEHQKEAFSHYSQRPVSSPAPPAEPQRSGLRSTLLDNINRRFGLRVKDFGPSWRDGDAFLTIIDALLPQMKAREKGRGVLTNRARLQLAFDLADRHLGVTKLLDAEDIDVSSPDERSIMTYVSQFLQKQPQPVKPPVKEPEILTPAVKAQPTKIRIDEGVSKIRKWIANLVKTGINQANLTKLQKEQADLKSDYDRLRDTLDQDTIRNWRLIENELMIARQVLDWISIAEEMLTSYSIPTSGEQVEEQLRRHKLFFSCLPKLESSSNLLDSIAGQYKEAVRLADEWKEALLEASRRWEQYHLAKDELKGWLTTAETKLEMFHQPHLNHHQQAEYLNDLKKFFSQRADNEKILYSFISSCNDVLATLPESHQTGLKETLRGLESRFHEITNFKAPQHLLRFEFDLTESNFMSRLNKDNGDTNNEEAILEDLNLMENLGTVYWKRFNDKSILDRAMFNRREYIKRKKKMKQDINFVKQETLELIGVAESQLQSITSDSQIEVLRHNEFTLNKIREQLTILRKLTNDADVDLERELKEIENHLERLLEQLKSKKKERIINWLENEAPKKLELFRSGSDHSLKDDVSKYRAMVVEEKELVEKVKIIDVQMNLIDIERCKVASVQEGKDAVSRYQTMMASLMSPELERYLKFLEDVVLVEWEAVDTIKNHLKDWLNCKKKDYTKEELKEKKDETDSLLVRFEKNKSIIERMASDSALRSLQKDLSDIICEYDQLWRSLEEDEEKMKKKNDVQDDKALVVVSASTSSQQQSSETGRQVKSYIEETVQRYEKTEKYEITRREKREEIIDGDVVESSCTDVQVHVDQTKDVIEVKQSNGKVDGSGDQPNPQELAKVKVQDEEISRKRRNEIMDQLKDIQEWIKANHLNRFMGDELPYCDESSLTKVKTIQDEWRIRKTQLGDIYGQLNQITDNQEIIRVYSDVEVEMDSFDFNCILQVLREAIAFREWLNDCKAKVENIEEKILQSDKVVNDMDEMQKDLDNLLTKIETIDVASIEKYLKVVDKVEEEKTILTKLSSNLKLLREKLVLKNQLEEEEAAAGDVDVDDELSSVQDDEESIIPLEEVQTELVEEDISIHEDSIVEENVQEDMASPPEYKVLEEEESQVKDAEEIESEKTGEEIKDLDEDVEEVEELEEDAKEEEAEPIDTGTTLSDWKQYYDGFSKWLRTNGDILESSMDKSFSNLESMEEVTKQIEIMREEGSTRQQQGLELIQNIKDTDQDKESLEGKARTEFTEIQEKLGELNRKGDQLKDTLDNLTKKWQEVQNLCEDMSIWMNGIESEVKSIDLKDTFQEKRGQLERLKRLKKSIDSKQASLKELSQQGETLNGSLKDQVDKINTRYESLDSSVENLTAQWVKYVNDHATLDNLLAACKDINSKTSIRLKEMEDVDDLEEKLGELNDLINSKESKAAFEKLDDQLQRVVGQTIAPARTLISNPVRETIRERNEMMSLMLTMRTSLNDKLAILQQSQMALKQVIKALDEIEYAIVEASLFTCSLSEKKSQWDKAKQLLRDCKIIDINSLIDKPEIAKEYAALVDRHEVALTKLDELVESNEKAYKDHQAFKESCDDFVQWMKNLRDRIPSLSAGCLSDRLSLETSISTFTDLLSRRSVGDQKLKNMKELGSIALESSSTDGKKLINRNTDNLEKDYSSLIGEIEKTIEHLQELQIELKKFKEEYEATSEWLQSMESEIKQERTVYRGATLQEKLANVATCNKLMESLEKGREERIGKLWEKDVLLKSHLENYIRNQLKLLESRYQVLTNLLKDVASKVNEIAENHELFSNKCQQAQIWIKTVSDKLDAIGDYENKKEAIANNLKLIAELTKRNQEEGQILVHQALNAGEKALRSTPSQGREVISLEIHEIQSKWDRYLNKLSETKSTLEVALIQYQELQLARNKMRQWLKEQQTRAANLRESNGDEYGSLKESLKSKMRKLNSLLQDLESHPEAHSGKIALLAFFVISLLSFLMYHLLNSYVDPSSCSCSSDFC